MTNRPDVEPAPTDTEIFSDPLPEEDLMDTCLNAFGSTEEIYVLPSGPRRGYVKFKEHSAAARAVEARNWDRNGMETGHVESSEGQSWRAPGR